MNVNKINAYIEQNIELNIQRLERIEKFYSDLMEFAGNEPEISEYGAQGSYPTETYLKPKDGIAFDLDFVIEYTKEVGPDNKAAIIKFYENMQDAIIEFGKQKQWPEFKLIEGKYGAKIEFASDLTIDIIPLFKNNGTQYIINFHDDLKPKFDKPLLLTKSLVRENDENKTVLIKIIKYLKRAQYPDLKNLDILPSIGISILTIMDLKNYSFSWENVARLIKDIIANKNAKLFNPFNPQEEFFGIAGGSWAENAKKFLINLDSIRLTIEKAIKENNDQILVDMLEKGLVVPSNGIDEKPSGSGGHA